MLQQNDVVYPLSEGADFDSVNRAATNARREWETLKKYSNMMRIGAKGCAFSSLITITESAGRICEYRSDVGEVVLNLAVERQIKQQGRKKERQESETPILRNGDGRFWHE